MFVKLKIIFIFLVLFLCLNLNSVNAEIFVKTLNNDKVVSMTGLSNMQCPSTYLSGIITNRQFESNGTVLQSFIIEEYNGRRYNINVDVNLNGIPRVDASWLVVGLQDLTRIGRQSQIKVFVCGAAGRIMYLDSIN